MRVDDVAGDICQALRCGERRQLHLPGQGLPNIARDAIDTHLKPPFLESYGIL